MEALGDGLVVVCATYCRAESGLLIPFVTALSEHLKFAAFVADNELPQFQPAEIWVDEFRAREYWL